MSTAATGASIISSKYQGHQAPVLALDISPDDASILLSGSEDQTARLWDVRSAKHRASLCIRAPGPVMSVSFVPVSPPGCQLEQPQAESPFSHNHTIYLSTDNHVLEYDLRRIDSPIVTNPTREWSSTLQNQDEINQIALTYAPANRGSDSTATTSSQKKKGNSKKRPKKKSTTNTSSSTTDTWDLYVAAADDAGTVRFTPTDFVTVSSSDDNPYQPPAPRSNIVHHDPNGVSLVPAIAFRPSSALELASGGTDCKLHLWDLARPSRPISSVTIQPLQDSQKPQVCNPPMVHSLDWSPQGKLLAAGLGDGNIPIYLAPKGGSGGPPGKVPAMVQTGILENGHDSSVASVMFPRHWKGGDRVLVSGGSDGSVFVWDLGPLVSVEGTCKDPSALFVDGWVTPATSSPSATLECQMEDLSLQNPHILFGIPHGSKVNWMTASHKSLFVSDTSNDITEYQLPFR
eukprot:Nitzschia sp. Nitz4//scaffold358_size24170//22008//23559//NITZ4_008435-RA/size24170-augustus-gene-0.46-mRNA-1//1//CDS//3329549014//7848//frame0